MTLTTLKLLFAVLIWLTVIIAGWYPFRKKLRSKEGHDFPLGQALASGVFLGAGLIHMLGDASSDFISHGFDYPLPFLLAGATFLILLWLEHLGRELYEHQGEQSPFFAILAVVMLSFHSFLAGAALGVTDNVSMAVLILVAILAHKWAASFSLAVHINQSSLKLKFGLLSFLIFSIMTPLGILIGTQAIEALGTYPLLAPILTALAAGTFLYLGTLHRLTRAVMVDKCCNLRHFSLVILGFAIMAVVAIWT